MNSSLTGYNESKATQPDDANRLLDTARSFACAITPLLRSYGGHEVKAELALGWQRQQGLAFGGANWKCESTAKVVSEHVYELELIFKVVGGVAKAVGVGLAFDFAGWLDDNYVFMPAAVYQGNDFKIVPVKYPPLWPAKSQCQADPPVTMTDLPRFTSEQPKLELTTGDLSTPCMGFYSPTRHQGVLIFTEQKTRLGNSGMTVEAKEGGVKTRFLVAAPCLRDYRQEHCVRVPCDDPPANWEAGDVVKLRMRVCLFSATQLQGLFDRFCELRKAMKPACSNHWMPFSAAAKLVEEKYNQENWDEGGGFFKMAPDSHTTHDVASNPLCFLWQLGWVGGGQVTLPLLFQGSGPSPERAWKNLGMIFARTQAASGFFYGIGDGRSFYGDGFDRPWPHNMHMVRKSADWLYYSIKHFDLLNQQGKTIPPAWTAGVRRLAEAFCTLWKRYGQFGQMVDVETGNLLVGGSCAGGLAPAGLVMAAHYFPESKHLEVIAKAAGLKYYEEFIRKGITNGGPGDILSAPDSESAFSLLESFVKLYEADGDPFWLQAARDTLRQAATWVVSYDYEFPETSDLGRRGVHTTGAVWANIQNKHAAPAICTLSGEAMFRFWRATRDPLALDLLHDIAHGIPQYLSRADLPLNDRMRPGWICERVNLSDWEGAGGVGGKLFGSCWPEVSLMLTAVEIPGLYVQPDTGLVHVFDHLIVEKVTRINGAVRVKLTNPTRFDADMKILCESSSACHRPLGLNPLYASPRLHIPAGHTVESEFQ